jgi:hypothetical protein
MKNYLMSMKPRIKSVEQLAVRHCSIEIIHELEICCEIQCVLLDMVDHVLKSAETTRRTITLVGGQKSSLSWQARALIIAFWVHPCIKIMSVLIIYLI